MPSSIVYSWDLLVSPPSAPTKPDIDGPITAPSLARDFKIDLLSTTREMVIEGGDFAFVYGAEAIKQEIDIRLRFFAGEWFLDESAGIPYFDRVLVKSPNLTDIRALIRAELLRVRGVTAVEQIDLTFDRGARKLSIAWRVATDLGLLNGLTAISSTQEN